MVLCIEDKWRVAFNDNEGDEPCCEEYLQKELDELGIKTDEHLIKHFLLTSYGGSIDHEALCEDEINVFRPDGTGQTYIVSCELVPSFSIDTIDENNSHKYV